MKGRKVDFCGMCGDEEEIAAHGLCYKCYRSVERACVNAKEHWNPGQLRRQKKLARAHGQMIQVLLDFGAGTHANATKLVSLMGAYLKPLADYLGEQEPPEEYEGEEGPAVPENVNTTESSRSHEDLGEVQPEEDGEEGPAAPEAPEEPVPEKEDAPVSETAPSSSDFALNPEDGYEGLRGKTHKEREKVGNGRDLPVMVTAEAGGSPPPTPGPRKRIKYPPVPIVLEDGRRGHVIAGMGDRTKRTKYVVRLETGERVEVSKKLYGMPHSLNGSKLVPEAWLVDGELPLDKVPAFLKGRAHAAESGGPQVRTAMETA